MREEQTILLAVALLCASACTSKTSAKASAAAPAGPPPVVVVAPVVQQTVPIYKELIGRTTAIYTVDVRSQATGILEKALFEQGQAVKKGQLLFTIDPSQYQAALQSAQATLSKARADVAQADATLNKNNQDVARYQPLMQQRAIPKEQYDTAVASVKTAQAQVQQMQAEVKQEQAAVHQAEINLSYTKIHSPIDGIAGIRQVDPGNLVSSTSTTPLVTISSSNPMDVQFDVSEIDYLRYIQRVRTPAQRQKAAADITYELLLPDGTTYPYKGKFVLADRAVNSQTGTLTIKARFPNPNNLLRPGQFVRIRFMAEQLPNAILAPQQAVQQLQGAQSVFVVNQQNKVELHTVTTNGTYQKDSIISSGLQAGQRVIVEGQQKVQPGMLVKPEP